MSLRYRNSQGTETPVAGLNGTSGELVPSVASIRTGNALFSTVSTGTSSYSVTFATPIEDISECGISVWMATGITKVLATAYHLTTTGFEVTIRNDNSFTLDSCRLYYCVFKLMTDTVHQADAAHIAQNTANFAPAFSEVTSYAVGDYCTYNNVLYRCTTAHTAGTWVAGHFTQVTVGGDLSEEPVLLGEWAVVTTAVQTKTLNESVANFRFLLIEVRTLGICRGSGYFRCHRDSSYEYLFRYFYQSAGYATAVTVKSNLTQVDIEIPTLQPSSGVTVSMYGIR